MRTVLAVIGVKKSMYVEMNGMRLLYRLNLFFFSKPEGGFQSKGGSREKEVWGYFLCLIWNPAEVERQGEELARVPGRRQAAVSWTRTSATIYYDALKELTAQRTEYIALPSCQAACVER